MIRVFLQARMSSQRFREKVLAPFSGRPVRKRLVIQVVHVFPHPQRFRVFNVSSDDPCRAALSFIVQTSEDSWRLEATSRDNEVGVEAEQ